MKMIFLWAIFGVVMISCNSSQKNNAPIKNSEIKTESQAHTSNLFGTYEGTLPAADCEGIKTILVINEDKTYTDRKSTRLNSSHPSSSRMPSSA